MSNILNNISIYRGSIDTNIIIAYGKEIDIVRKPNAIERLLGITWESKLERRLQACHLKLSKLQDVETQRQAVLERGVEVLERRYGIKNN